MNYDLILIRYGELSLKSSYVRKQFTFALIRNIKRAFHMHNLACDISTERGRIYLDTDQILAGVNVLQNVFGITSVSPAIKTTSQLEDMIALSLKCCEPILHKGKSFALRVKRTGEHDFSSQDIAVKLGNVIVEATTADVDLTHPDVELFIEIRDDIAFFFTEKIRGTGGMPLGTQGSLLALISTPQSLLSAWYLMRRGCDIHLLLTNNSLRETVEAFLRKWYAKSDIISIDSKSKNLFEHINMIASQQACAALVTDHSLYDTSRDVLSEIKHMKTAVRIPIVHPLIAMDEDEIQQQCKELGIIQ